MSPPGHAGAQPGREHAHADAVLTSFHAYSYPGIKHAVAATARDAAGFHVRLFKAKDVLVVTGPGLWNTAPKASPDLTLAAETILKVRLSAQTRGDATIHRTTIVVLRKDGSLKDLVLLDLESKNDGTVEASGATYECILAEDGYFRVMVYARGTGEIIIKDLQILFIP